MRRVISFGDSCTFGHGLPDCHDETGSGPGDYPSKYAWPAKIAEYLGHLNWVNYAYPGASNKEILWTLMQNERHLKDDDLIFIQWTYPHRKCILTADGREPIRLFPQAEDEPSVRYYEQYETEADSVFESQIWISYADGLLSNRDCTHLFFTRRDKRIFDIGEWTGNGKGVDKVMGDFKHIGSYARDGMHPGVDAHDQWAKYLISEIRKTQTII